VSTAPAPSGLSSLAECATAIAEHLGLVVAVVEVDGVGRAAERAAGRAAAREAFAAAGAPGLEALGTEPDGRPVWPSGWAGSISHGAGVAVAAVSRSHRAVGIDVERSGALSVEDAELVLTPSEQELAANAADPAAVTTVIWSAKEACFKAWSGACGGLNGVDPVDIFIHADVHAGTLRARAGPGLGDGTAVHEELDGGFATVGEVLLTVVAGR
jgi:4'-phosphopantetheinyl transferase EntD